MRTSFATLCLIVAVVAHPLNKDKIKFRKFKTMVKNALHEKKESNETVDLAEVPVLPSAWHADATMLIDGS